jgi:catechol 2,3-dioxygenase-like lactoylglutathione lyase family enzyme
MIASLGARVHLFVHPELRERFTTLFKDVLQCRVLERDFGLAYPLLFVPFPDGSGFSVEFTELAPGDDSALAPNDEHAFRGAWIEFRTPDLAAAQQKLREAGIREFRHPGSTHVYFSAPGGQVFRLLDLDYKGP